MLTGDGGDELFAGYTRYAETVRDSYLDHVPLLFRQWGAGVSYILPHFFPGKYYLDYSARDRRSRYIYNLSIIPSPCSAHSFDRNGGRNGRNGRAGIGMEPHDATLGHREPIGRVHVFGYDALLAV